MPANTERRCVVVMWSEENQSLVSYTIDVQKVLTVTQRLFPLELPLADYNDTIDDEFARRFGCATLSLLAITNPELKPYMKVSEQKEP